MKTLLKNGLVVPCFSFLLAIAAPGSASAADASDAPRVARTVMALTEKDLDDRFTRLWNDNPVVLLGPTRGVYLEGYGVVFTAEVNLVAGPSMGFFPVTLDKDEKAKFKDKKLSRIPQLKAALAKALADTAASKQMAAVPPAEQIVLVAFLSHYPYEDLTGVPAQIIMQGSKKKLNEAKSAGGSSLDAAIQAAQF